jgi:hypothetical protein
MRQGVQTLLAELGEAACLALCICELGKPGIPEAEAVGLILEGMKKGYIDYDENDRSNRNNCFVNDRDGFMELVTGQKGWKSTREGPGYKAKPQERVIECWRWDENVAGKTVPHQHFRLPAWDPIKDARTVRFGRLESYRVFRKAA